MNEHPGHRKHIASYMYERITMAGNGRLRSIVQPGGCELNFGLHYSTMITTLLCIKIISPRGLIVDTLAASWGLLEEAPPKHAVLRKALTGRVLLRLLG